MSITVSLSLDKGALGWRQWGCSYTLSSQGGVTSLCQLPRMAFRLQLRFGNPIRGQRHPGG
ncbi:unnamed protein product [Gadus morhua 'NCC']